MFLQIKQTRYPPLPFTRDGTKVLRLAHALAKPGGMGSKEGYSALSFNGVPVNTPEELRRWMQDDIALRKGFGIRSQRVNNEWRYLLIGDNTEAL